MIGIHIVSHGNLCSGIIDSLQMIIGNIEQIGFSSLKEDSCIDEYKEEMLKKSKKLNTGKGVLVFADMYGATPYNTALFNSREFDRAEYKIISGFNLSILIDAALNRETMSLTDLVEAIRKQATDSIVFPDK